ncbi:hypothetical protein NGG16_16290 [Enterococcus casseliflavus]|uniref:hypothetical protein n=1 Tax=Enterococcus casseliflavus TaxID=37734 RepID=UPI002DBCEAB9|nr:hypothetical protein [Enterococcus casseliflavus]MEB8418995.1 hypothetical protein [Enterococcus casseliflavus]
MIVEEKLRICVVKEEKISRKIPEDFGRLFLQHYMKSNGWTVSGAAFASRNTLLIWQKEEENKTLQDLLPIHIINSEIYELLKNKVNWLDMKVSVVVETIIQ